MSTDDLRLSGVGIAPPAHRLPGATRPGRVRLQVSDLRRSLDWYQEVLGLRALELAEGCASLGPQDGGSVLVELHERPGASPVPRRGRLGLYHFAILLPDRAALGTFVRHLSELDERAGASDHLVSEALYLTDPDGLGIEVYADRPRTAWRLRGAELVMATEPLDLGSLLRAAGDATWQGTPAGTTIGHVHLHVGDLGMAAAFYHEALGLDKVVWSYPGALFLSAGGYHHHLGVNTWAAGAEPARADEARLLDWELLLPDAAAVERTLASLEGAGYLAERDQAGATVADPWGTRLRIAAADTAAG